MINPVSALVRLADNYHRFGMLCKTHGQSELAAEYFAQRRVFMGAARTIHNYGIVTVHPKRAKRQRLLG